jgi:hypothetical protein
VKGPGPGGLADRVAGAEIRTRRRATRWKWRSVEGGDGIAILEV